MPPVSPKMKAAMQTRRTDTSFEAPWALPPDLPWARFLRLLRRPDPPRGWLEAAALLDDLRRRPLLLRWVAQHPKAPAHLRARLLGRLPLRALAAIAHDASAHPQARAMSVERLLHGWPGLSMGERRSLALIAPQPLWRMAWRSPDAGVIRSLLLNARLSLESLIHLIQPPLTPVQADALGTGPHGTGPALGRQVLSAFDRTLAFPEHGLVLGQATPWIRGLSPEEAIEAAAAIADPALRRIVRSKAGTFLD